MKMKEPLQIEEDIAIAKGFVKKETDSTSVYETLSSLIGTVLEERPSADTEFIETFLGKQTIKDEKSERQTKLDIQTASNLAETQVKLFDKSTDEENYGGGDGGGENEEEFEIPINCTQLSFYFEQAGVGVGREETYRIYLSLKQLVYSYPLSSIRFWGKIFGVESNYIIAEAEYREGEGDEEEEEEAAEYGNIYKQLPDNFLIKSLLNIIRKPPHHSHPCKRCIKCGLRKRGPNHHVPNRYTVEEEEDLKGESSDGENEGEDGPSEENSVPKSTWKPTPDIPKEDHRTGVNKKVYFVCNEPGEEWTKLPHTTPKEIAAARSITKFLTGRLDAKVECYPPFPGVEANYLRAQITRISAGTQISPAGYYMFDDEEEEEEEEERDSYMQNVDFEGISLQELTDPSMISWVHHAQHILPQGRCTWFNPSQKPEDDFEEEEYEDDEDGMGGTQIQPETGPPLLSSVAIDNPVRESPAWTVFVSSRVLPEYSIAVAKSNRWPGAYAFSTSRTFENIYIGWGNKYTGECFNPAAPPPAFEEYPDGPETTEMDDPTVEEERALEEREKEALKAAEDMEDVDDEDDDDD